MPAALLALDKIAGWLRLYLRAGAVFAAVEAGTLYLDTYMKRNFILLLLLALAAGPAAAAESIEWEISRPEFKFFSEKKHFTQESWEKLPQADQADSLRTVKDHALQRQESVRALYSQAAAGKWNAQQAGYFTDRYTGEELNAVQVWIGAEQGHELAHKVATVRAMIQKAAVEGLDQADAAALQPYLQAQTITELRSAKFAADLLKQKATAKPKTAPSQSAAKLDKVGPDLDAAKLGGMYDKYSSGAATADLGAAPAAMLKSGVSKVPLSANPNATAATTIKSATPGSLDPGGTTKSTAWASDAYGITVETPQGKKSYRDHNEAEAAIRQMPAGSVKKITLYGHGSPGMQTVGPGQYDALYTAELLDGKMAKNGVIQFSGCNTASIGDATLNPAVGLSMAARRLLYFSLPYWQDRADGVPAAQAKQQWEKEWNADLSHDTSTLVKGAIVCGYRTFGLVPGRLPGLTKLLGNQDATEPGYVAGKKVCYQNGKEVPAP
jgi:hypothetical protein